jgi:hypothetical protein
MPKLFDQVSGIMRRSVCPVPGGGAIYGLYSHVQGSPVFPKTDLTSAG